MWVEVIKRFKDKYTGQVYQPGEKLNLKKDRIKEIQSVGNLVKVVSK